MDTRRTILWLIFSFSMLFLWNNWQVYNGNPSLFGGTRTTQQASTDTAPDAGNAPAVADGSIPVAEAPPAAASPGAVPAGEAIAPTQDPVVVTTDVLRLTFDPVGARIVKAELLAYDAVGEQGRPTVLLDNRPGYVYVAETGVVGPQGANFPTHRTPFQVTTQDRELTGEALQVSFAAEAGGIRLVKTYTLH